MIRYAEMSDYNRIYEIWSNSLGQIQPLPDYGRTLSDEILKENFLIKDDRDSFCLFGVGEDRVHIRGVVVEDKEDLEDYVSLLRRFSSNIDIDCLDGSIISKLLKSDKVIIRSYVSKEDRLKHLVINICGDAQISGECVETSYRRVRCRFRNEEDLRRFADKNNILLSSDTREYNVETHQYGFSSSLYRESELKDSYWESEWGDMPKFEPDFRDLKSYASIDFLFRRDVSNDVLSTFFDRKMTERTKSCWYPELEVGEFAGYRVLGGDSNTRYPIYVVSKNRSTRCFTSIILAQMEVPHYVVVEPDDYKDYCKNLNNKFTTVLIMDMSYKERYDTFDNLGLSKSTGPGPARNFCWDDSIKRGYKWHWVFDDNAGDGFYYVYKNVKLRCHTGAIFRAMEDFVDRYDNLAIAGMNYYSFYAKNSKRPAFTMNTRIYSFLLIRNDIPYRWRGRYNEDTDLSLRVLKDGWCTVEFNAFLAGKVTTQRVPGGNTEEFYSKEGTLPKSKMLQDMHPDVARVSWKFGRWHHEVDYSGFTQKLHRVCRDGDKNSYNMYGMIIVPTKEHKGYILSKSQLEEKYRRVIDVIKDEKFQDSIFNLKYKRK